MNNWKFWRLVVLLVLVGGLAWILYTRGIPGRFGAVPATLQTDYKTEHDWAIRQTALDIQEMAAFADRRSAQALPSVLPPTPWEPDAFRPIAAAAFGDAVSVSTTDPGVVELYPELTALDVPTLIESAKTVSQMLAANMRNPRAHESAALVIGAFALRDAADLFTDVRWALNRMTAHLAVARALRGSDHAAPDGAIANIVLLALANHQSRALAELGALGSGSPPEPMNSWIRALHLRITHDWRALAEPSTASRLEKLEFFRARRLTVRRQRAQEHLTIVDEPLAADFARIAQDSGVGVEDGHRFVMEALDMELDEAGRAYQRIHGRPMPQSLGEALNHRAGRLIGDGPQVLPWGAWAEFYQRHIAMNIGMVDSHVRHRLGDHEGANTVKRQLDTRLATLTLFPLGTLRRTKGSYGTEADQSFYSDVIALAAQAPELVPMRAWSFVEWRATYEPIPQRMPLGASWFGPATPHVPFEASERPRADQHLDELLAAAPHDTALLATLAIGDGEAPLVKRARGLLAQHHDYDLRALDAALTHVDREELRIPLKRKACAISSRDCIALASSLLYFSNDEPGAAAMYEQAFADPFIDALARAADSYWLTTYYHRIGQTSKAVVLAEQVARTGSGHGYFTRGRLYERVGNLDGAEKDFMINAQRYQDLEGLLAFYYRRVEVDGNQNYAARWEKWRAEIFPNGMQPEPATLAGVPQTGVFINRDSEFSRRSGIRAGDIVVGLEGWRVDNVNQYRVINFLKDDPIVRLTISRGGQLIKVEAKSPTRLFGTQLETHPMKGWIQD